MTELGDRFEQAMPRIPAVLVADHGLYTWGTSLLKTRHHTEIVEWLLEFTITMDDSLSSDVVALKIDRFGQRFQQRR